MHAKHAKYRRLIDHGKPLPPTAVAHPREPASLAGVGDAMDQAARYP